MINQKEFGMRTQYRVWPIDLKPRYYNNLEGILEDFTADEIRGANISVLLKGVVVGHLDTDKVLNEIYD